MKPKIPSCAGIRVCRLARRALLVSAGIVVDCANRPGAGHSVLGKGTLIVPGALRSGQHPPPAVQETLPSAAPARTAATPHTPLPATSQTRPATAPPAPSPPRNQKPPPPPAPPTKNKKPDPLGSGFSKRLSSRHQAPLVTRRRTRQSTNAAPKAMSA